MRKAIAIWLAPVLLIVAALVPVTAEGAGVPRWFVGWKSATTPVQAMTWGNAALTFDVTGAGVVVRCRLTASDTIVNTLGGGAGTDEMTAFKLSKCKPKSACKKSRLEVIAQGLPWHSHLVAGPPIRDVIEGVEVTFRCSGGEGLGTFAGTLSPIVNDQAAKNAKNCVPTNPTPCAQLEFGAEPLLSGKSETLTVSGVDKIKGPVNHNASQKAIEVKLV